MPKSEKLYLSPRDKRILRHIEQYQATINQIAKIFFPKNQNNYTYAQTRLRKLFSKNCIKQYQPQDNKQMVYYIPSDAHKQWNQHSLYLMDFYANLVFYGCEIKQFEKEYQWKQASRRSDGAFIFNYNNIIYSILVEVDFSHQTSQKKIEELYASQEPQDKLGEFPYFCIINPTGHDYEYNFKHPELKEKVIYLDYSQFDFGAKVISLL
jgi:predicted transcriptional regulator